MESNLILNKSEIPEKDIDTIKLALTLKNPAYEYQRYTLGISSKYINIPRNFYLYEETPETLIVPRAVFDDEEITSKLLKKHKITTLPTILTDTPKWNSSKTLKSFQKYPAKMILENKADIITAKCGSGKTVIGVNIATHIKPPICIVVHQKFLADQWLEEFKTFSTFKNIVLHENQKVKKSLEADVVIATVQSLIRLENEIFFDNFNIVIFDEVHVMGAMTFCKVISKFKCRRIGVTATPDRTDGFKAYQWNIGGRLVAATNEDTLQINIIGYNTGYARFINEGLCVVKDSINIPKILNAQYAIEQRFQDTCTLITELLELGRHVIVLSHRREYAIRLYTDICFEDKELLLGKVKIGKEHKQFVSATFQLLRAAFNRPRLDTLIHTGAFTAENDVEQTIGRLTRPVAGKPPAIVIDMYETTYNQDGRPGYLSYAFNKRMETYNKLNCRILNTNANLQETIKTVRTIQGGNE